MLRAAVAATGLVAIGLYPLMQLWPSGWMWEGTSHSHYAFMIDAVYFVLGVFLLTASRDPLRHRSLLWFAIWSSVAHAVVMAVRTTIDVTERSHWAGDIPALLIASVLLAVLLRREERRSVVDYSNRSASIGLSREARSAG